MEKRKLGRSGLEVSPICFGGNVFGWTVNEEDSFQILDAFVDAGFNFIDTADVYSRFAPGNSGGESETILGKWFAARGNREKVILATKVGMDMGDGKSGLSKKYIIQAVEDSLQRLQTDYIDLYQSHKDDPDTPQSETLEAYDQLIREGKVRSIGASNFSAERLRESLQISKSQNLPRYESLQPLYNLYDRDSLEGDLEKICLEEQIGVIGYFSLASGFLTGKYRGEKDLEGRARGERIRKYLNEKGYRILEALDKVSQETGAKPAQVSMAWLLSKPFVTSPIASATNMDQLEDLIASASLYLEPAQIALLDEVSSG